MHPYTCSQTIFLILKISHERKDSLKQITLEHQNKYVEKNVLWPLPNTKIWDQKKKKKKKPEPIFEFLEEN